MRPFSRISALLLLTLVFAAVASAKTRAAGHRPPATNPLYTEGGYANRVTVEQGGTIEFHLATGVPAVTLQLIDLTAPDTVLQTIELSGGLRDCTGLSEAGCHWPVSAVFTVPVSWPSGYYAARFRVSNGTDRFIFFVVREDVPGSSSRMVLVVPTHTYQAYNDYGYKSLYPSNSPARNSRVSYDRPYFDNRGLGRFPRWEEPFVKWLLQEGMRFEVIADPDLEDPDILGRYDVAVFAGHSEYWTSTARAHLETFVANGGRVAIFGGNTMWWQARLENDARTLVVYKSAADDPETGRNNSIVTTNYYAAPVLRPENFITGSSFRNGGFTNRNLPVFGYTVTDPQHWAFAGTSATRGTPFGNIAAGVETDGALYNCAMDGLAGEVDGSDGTPLNFRILATVPAAEGHGTVGIYTTPAGGAVFNAGTQDWVLGLTTDAIVTAMTRNVLRRFLEGRVPYEPVQSNVRMRELFNCALDTTEEKIVPGWRGDEGHVAVTSRCASEGPRGLELTGDDRIRLVRGFAPAGNTVDHIEARFQLNADATTGPADVDLDFFTLQMRTIENVVTRATRVELDPAAKRVRMTLFDALNASFLHTPWIPLSGGWNAIELSWRSGGLASLRVGTGSPQTLQNPTAGQSVGEVFLDYEDPRVGGYLCVDALTLQ
jgi:hypothetical protein